MCTILELWDIPMSIMQLMIDKKFISKKIFILWTSVAQFHMHFGHYFY